MHLYLVLLLSLCVIFKGTKTEQNFILSFCKDTSEGDWREKVKELFGMTRVGIAELYCNGVSNNDIAVGTLVGEDYEQITKPPHEHLNVYLSNLLRRMSSSLVTTVSTIDELQNSLKNDQNTVVAYIEAQDSIEHQVFQQVALAIEIPEDLNIIATQNRELFSNYDIQVEAGSRLQVWFVKNEKWLLLEVPSIGGEVTIEEAHLKLLSFLRNLNYPLIFPYNGGDFMGEVYKGANLDFALVFHTSKQKKEIVETVVEPLSKEFQLYFAFITIDCDEFPDMLEGYNVDINNVTLPLLMSLKNKQKRGVQIESEKVSYTDLEALTKVLNLIRTHKEEVIPVDSDYEEEQVTSDDESKQETQHEHDHSEL